MWKPKKAFIVTIVLPDEWDREDVVTACNLGIKNRSLMPTGRLALTAFDYSVTVQDSFKLRIPENQEGK